MVKICHNVFLGVVIQSLAEITVLAEKAGVPRHAFLDFLNKSVMGSVFSRYKTPALVNLDFKVTFTPYLLRKDLDLGLATGERDANAVPEVGRHRDRQRQGQGQSLTVTDLLRSFPEYANIVRLVCSQTLPVVSDDTIPEMLAKHPRYEVTGRLGMGGMGTVFAGRHMVLGRDVAIKVIRNEYLASPAARERFLREAQTAARLQHPNVVTVYDAEATDAGQFLVMEAVSGADLARTVDENGPLPWEAACDAIQQAAAGLEAARQIGLVHRDLSQIGRAHV